jgi:hypothetical protein
VRARAPCRSSGNWLVPSVADKLLHMELEEEAGGRVSALAQQYMVRARLGVRVRSCACVRVGVRACVGEGGALCASSVLHRG